MICVSLVDDPAVQSDFLAFNKDDKPVLFRVEDEAKRRLLGVVMRADYPIYRWSPDKGEFYMVFKPDTIREMAQKYLKDNYQNKVDLMHDGEMISGIEMVQWFIKDTAKGVCPNGFDKIADGSLFGEYQITDDNLWNEVIAGTYKGFSLEGYFGLAPETDEKYTDGMATEYEGLFSEIKNKLKQITDMTKLQKIKEALKSVVCEMEKFGSMTTDKGVLQWGGDEELKVGDKVYIEQDGEPVAAEDGEYTTEDKVVIVVANGEVTEIKDTEEQPADTPAEEPNAEPEAQAEEIPAEEPNAEPAEEPNKAIEELTARIDALEKSTAAQFAEIISRLEALEGKPAAEEAHKQYKAVTKQDNEKAVRIAAALRR